MSDDDKDKWPLAASRPAPQWAAGIFYPLIVAGLIGVLVVLQGLREDVAVIKATVGRHDRLLERALELPTGRHASTRFAPPVITAPRVPAL